MSRRKSETEFCSPACSVEYLQVLAAKRLGLSESTALALTSPRLVTVSPKVRQIRERPALTDAHHLTTLADSLNLEEPTSRKLLSEPTPPFASYALKAVLLPPIFDDPSRKPRVENHLVIPVGHQMPAQSIVLPVNDPPKPDEVHRLARPRQRPAPLNLRGIFPFFPIGDMALVAPVQLPNLVPHARMAVPRIDERLRDLKRPSAQCSPTPAHAGINAPIFDEDGTPQLNQSDERITLIQSFIFSIPAPAFGGTRLRLLQQPEYSDLPPVLARISEQDYFTVVACAGFPAMSVELATRTAPLPGRHGARCNNRASEQHRAWLS